MYKSVEELQKLNIDDNNDKVINEYLDYLFSKINVDVNHICRTYNLNKDLNQVITCSNESILYEMEDTCIINQLDRLINRKEYLSDFIIENGKVTMIVAPLGISYDINYLYKKIKDKKVDIILLEDLYDFVRREFISSATSINSHKIANYDLSIEEFKQVKDTAKTLRDNICLQPYSCIHNNDEYESLYGFEESDLIIAYRMRLSMKDKNSIIFELKELAKKLNKPVLLVYHPNHKTIHNLKLSSITNLKLDNIDFIYGMLPGIDGYFKLK